MFNTYLPSPLFYNDVKYVSSLLPVIILVAISFFSIFKGQDPEKYIFFSINVTLFHGKNDTWIKNLFTF